MKKILIAVDGSEDSNKAIEKGAKLAKGSDSEVVLVAVQRCLVELESYLPGISYLLKKTEQVDEEEFNNRLKEFENKLASIGRGLLDESKKSLEKAGITNVKTVLKCGKPAEEILKVAEEEKADLIVIGSRGKGLSKTVFGSVSRAVAMGSKVSVPW